MIHPSQNGLDINSLEEFALEQIAEMWSREQGKLDREKILEFLVQAIFRREFSGRDGSEDRLVDNLDFLLITLFDQGGLPDDSHLAIANYSSSPHPKLSVKNRTIVNSGDIFVFSLKGALIDLAALANTPISQYPESGRRTLGAIPLSRNALFTWCTEKEIPFPQFWRRGETIKSIKLAKLEINCLKWMKGAARDFLNPTKSRIKIAAKKKFPGLGDRQFDRVWRKGAPENWKQPGAKRKKP